VNINATLIQFLLPFTNSWANPLGVLCYHTLGYPKHGGRKNIKVVKIGCNLLRGGYHMPHKLVCRVAQNGQTHPKFAFGCI